MIKPGIKAKISRAVWNKIASKVDDDGMAYFSTEPYNEAYDKTWFGVIQSSHAMTKTMIHIDVKESLELR